MSAPHRDRRPEHRRDHPQSGHGLKRSARTNSSGLYHFEDLPIGTYTVTISQSGFQREEFTNIVVQANRTATVSTRLKAGSAETTVEVTGTPLLDKVGTTSGYVLSSQQIEEAPLGTGGFTQLAIFSPGVNADLLGGSGTNSGFGNRAMEFRTMVRPQPAPYLATPSKTPFPTVVATSSADRCSPGSTSRS